MAYAIDRYNNTLLTTVEDGTVDQTTDLKFIGKNYAGYGEIQNENFLFLLENFSGANQPSRPISGQVWFDSGTSKLKFYDGTRWRTTGGAEIGATEPTGLAIGDFWWDSGNDQLYVYNGTSFVLIGPQNSGDGVTQMQSIQVLDNTSTVRNIIVSIVDDETIFVISSLEFTLNISETALISQGFNVIKQGVTLRNTPEDGITTSDDRYWGTSSNSLKLGGIDAANYVTTGLGNTIFTTPIEIRDDEGIFIGEAPDLQIKIEEDIQAVVQNITNNGVIRFKVSNTSPADTHVITIDNLGLSPSTDNTFRLGTASLKFSNVYATNFTGEATQATTLRVGSSFRTASASADANTIAARDATGNIAANLFEGVATQARYADLAEKYSTSKELEPGTVVTVCEHEDYEVEAASVGTIAIGVVSTQPAVMMNSDAEGQYIGLKGRLPVRVVGAVKKGQAVYVNHNGCASIAINGGSLVGVALESNSDEGEKLVECVLKV